MAEEPDNLVLSLLREMRADTTQIRSEVLNLRGEFKDLHSDFRDLRRNVHEVRLAVAAHDLRFDALDEKFEMIREGTVSAIGYAANASRAHVDLQKQVADLTRRVEKLEAAK